LLVVDYECGGELSHLRSTCHRVRSPEGYVAALKLVPFESDYLVTFDSEPE